MAKLITEVGAASVVNRQLLNKLPTEELAATLAALYGKEDHTVLIVDHPDQFFSTKNLMRELDTNGPGLHIILEQRGVVLTDEQRETIELFAHVKASIEDQLIALTPPPPPYPFADLPDGWVIDEHIKFNTNTIRRIKGGTDYAIGNKACRALWDWIAPYWAGNVRNLGRHSHYVRASGYSNYAEPHRDRVEIGCQTIRRYELEQVALKMGWDVPEPKNAAADDDSED